MGKGVLLLSTGVKTEIISRADLAMEMKFGILVLLYILLCVCLLDYGGVGV